MAAASFSLLTAILLLFVAWIQTSVAFIADFGPLRINCGGGEVVEGGVVWSKDDYFQGGVAFDPNPSQSSNSTSNSLRAFDSESCYKIPAVGGRFLVRLGFFYSNYDLKNTPPTFIVSLNKAVVLDTSYGLSDQYNNSLVFSEFFTFVSNKSAVISICFFPQTGESIVNSIEVIPIDTDAYNTGSGFILSTLLRVNVGGDPISGQPVDKFGRAWEADTPYIIGNTTLVSSGSNATINGSDTAPEYIPNQVLSTARELDPSLNSTSNSTFDNEFYFTSTLQPLNPYNAWMLRVYFSEFNSSAKNGTRVFKLQLSSRVIFYSKLLDIFTETQSANSAIWLKLVILRDISITWSTLTLTFSKQNNSLPPVLGGVELLELIPLSSNMKNYRSRHSSWIAVILLASVITLSLVIILLLVILIYRKKRQSNNVSSSLGGENPESNVPRSKFFGNWFQSRNRYEPSVHGEFRDPDVELSNTR